MPEQENKLSREVKCTVVAVLCWFAVAPLITAAAALILCRGGITYKTLGYGSSALSFILAVLAAATAIKISGMRKLLTGIICGTALSVLLISFGYIAAGEKISASGIISVITFTMCGALCASIFTPTRKIKGLKRKKQKS